MHHVVSMYLSIILFDLGCLLVSAVFMLLLLLLNHCISIIVVDTSA